MKTKEKILFIQIFSSIFYISHYFLLNATLAGFVYVIEFIRLIVFYLIEKNEKLNTRKINIIASICLVIALTITSIFTWQNIWCIIPLISSILLTLSLGTKNIILLKSAYIFSTSCAIIYMVIIGSYFGACAQIPGVIASIIGLIYAIKNIKQQNNKNNIIIKN